MLQLLDLFENAHFPCLFENVSYLFAVTSDKNVLLMSSVYPKKMSNAFMLIFVTAVHNGLCNI